MIIHGKKYGESLENSVFIATFVGDSTKNLYSKNRNREKNNLHIIAYEEKYIQR